MRKILYLWCNVWTQISVHLVYRGVKWSYFEILTNLSVLRNKIATAMMSERDLSCLLLESSARKRAWQGSWCILQRVGTVKTLNISFVQAGEFTWVWATHRSSSEQQQHLRFTALRELTSCSLNHTKCGYLTVIDWISKIKIQVYL